MQIDDAKANITHQYERSVCTLIHQKKRANFLRIIKTFAGCFRTISRRIYFASRVGAVRTSFSLTFAVAVGFLRCERDQVFVDY